MAESLLKLLCFAFGFISDKLRDYGAEKLQDGGLTDQKFRGLIVRELADINSKLDAISRKDLGASISQLQKGIERLYMCLDASDQSKNPTTSETSNAATSSTKTWSTKSAPQVTVEDAVALANAIGKMKITSNERFESAKESFKQAESKACDAFHNTSLSTEDRILACKVRIASGILEHMEDPEFASTDCLQYLKELNDMPAIQKIFLVDLNGGINSLFKRNSRTDIVETITMINLILADFITKFTKRRMPGSF